MSCVVLVCREVLNDEMFKACTVYAQWLVDSSSVTDDDKVTL